MAKITKEAVGTPEASQWLWRTPVAEWQTPVTLLMGGVDGWIVDEIHG